MSDDRRRQNCRTPPRYYIQIARTWLRQISSISVRGEPTTAEIGYLRCGPNGAGHFVKMVHNGIEYGLIAAFAEGLNIIRNADAGKYNREVDPETTPLRHPEHYRYDINLKDVTEVWRRGSVVGSWLLDLTAAALRENPDLSNFEGRVSDSGEGRWTVQATIMRVLQPR